MNPGELRSRAIIEKRTITLNSFGGTAIAWATYDTVWAKVNHLSGRELEMAQQVSSKITYEITIRYRTDLADVRHTEVFRFNYDNKLFNILDIKDFENRHKLLYVKCEVAESEYYQQ